MVPSSLHHLDALAGGLFLLCGFGILATRQMLALLRLFIAQSALLAVAAILVGAELGAPHLVAVALITMLGKVALVPWLLGRTVPRGLYGRREVIQVLNIPTALLLGAMLTLFGFFTAASLVRAAPGPFVASHLPIGVAALLLGTCALTLRREALAQLFALLTVENGALFAGLAIAPELPLLAELAAVFDVLVVVLVVGLLTRRIHRRVGTTSVGLLRALHEPD